MRIHSIYRVELVRILHDPLTWLLTFLTALAPLAGYSFYAPTFGDSMSALYLANPMLTGGLAGTLLFAIIMLVSLNRPLSSRIGDITDAIISPLFLCVVRLLAVLTTGIIIAVAVGVLYLPYTIYKLDIVFTASDYFLSVTLFFLSGPMMGALAAATVWQLVQRLDISLLTVLAALFFSRGQWCSQYFLAQWSVPLVSTLSDAFGSAIVWRTAFYSRLIWLCFFIGAWLLTLLCVRQYGKNAFGSFACHARKAGISVFAALLLCFGGFLCYFQPFVDHTPANFQELVEEKPDRTNESLTLKSTQLNVSVNSYTLGTMSGRATFTIQNNSGKPQALYFELNSGYKVHSITANGEAISYEDLKNDLIAAREVICVLPTNDIVELEISYGGMAQMWNQMESTLGADTISSQGVTMVSKSLAPVLAGCVHVPEDSAISLYINLKQTLTPVSSAALTKLADNTDGTTSWLLEDIGTDRIFLYSGDYVMVELDAGNGTSIPFYYSKKYQSRLKNGALELMEKAIQYCTEHYGARSDADSGFKIIQTTAFDFGGFAVQNISGMGESYFSDENLNDPDKGSGSAEVLAHEIIHQWWGLSATLMDMDDNSWGDEGITVYTTYRLMCEIMGQEYAQKIYVDNWKNTMNNLHASFYQRYPEFIKQLPERYQAEIQAASDGANWYDGNALMIYRAAQIIGEDKMDDVWARLYEEGGTEFPPYISLGDFLDACGLKEGELRRD